MKKSLLFVAFIGILCFNLDAQNRPSLTKTAGQVETLSAENKAQNERIALLEATNAQLMAKVDTVTTPPAIPEGGIKVPTDEIEAYTLWAFILAFLNWLIVSVLKDHVPKWLSNKFLLSIIVGVLITGLGLVFSKGQFTPTEAFWFFVEISGLSNLIHQVKKPQNVDNKTVAA